MLLKCQRGGVSIIEMMIAGSLMLTIYMGYVSVAKQTVNVRTDLERKWIANLVATNVVNSLSSMTKKNFYLLMKEDDTILDQGSDLIVVDEFDNMTWVSWKDIYSFIDDIEINICVKTYDLTGCKTSAALTNMADFSRNSILITVDVWYQYISNKKKNRVRSEYWITGE